MQGYGRLMLALLGLALVWTVFLVTSYDIAFWYDEVFTLGAAGVNGTPDWDALRRDVHPPTHPLIIHLAATSADLPLGALRLTNLLALLPLSLAGWFATSALGAKRAALAALLMLTGALFFHLSLELRAYGLLLAAAALGSAALLAIEVEVPGARAALFAASILLTTLHFFGAALGVALLLTLAAHDPRRALVPVLLAICLAAATLLWAFAIGDVRGALGGALWIQNGLEPWLGLVAAQPLLTLAWMGLLMAPRRGLDPPTGAVPRALMTLAPGAMVIAVAAAISLHSPVISTKNLTVVIPGLALAAALLTPAAILTRLDRSLLTPAVVTAVASAHAVSASNSFQYIEWAVETATPAPCVGLPLYTIDPDIVDRYAQQVFLGEILRPPTQLRTLSETSDLSPYRGACDIVAADFHEDGPASDVVRLFAARGLSVRIEQAPDPRAETTDQMRMGFVVRVLSDDRAPVNSPSPP
ncbi:MAG: hypothetical protein AAGA32_10685 [Pseudomonadota bacterium]